jgi:Alkylmercury lyase
MDSPAPAVAEASDLRRGDVIMSIATLDPAKVNEVYHHLLVSFSESGQPPTPQAIARRFNLPLEATDKALEIIEAQGNIYRDPTTRAVLAAYPFSAGPTPHIVRFPDGHWVYAMCAIDALGMPSMLGTDATIESRCAHCDKAIHVEVQHNTLHGYEPRGAQVWYMPVNHCCVPALEQCPSINFFCSAEHLAAWRAIHSDMRGDRLTIEEALGRGTAVFGNLIKGNEEPVPPVPPEPARPSADP